jgi:uncharacterized protein YndB with AHSA1/START domain
MIVSHAANSGSFAVTIPSDQEIRMSRLFNAPRPLLFDAITRCEHMSQWRGRLDEHYAVLVCESDLRPGGAYRFVGRHPWGEVASHGEYREIVPPSRLVYSQSFDELPGVVAVLTTEFAEEGPKTRMTVTVWYPSLEVRDLVLASGMASVARLSYDRLEEHLAALQGGLSPAPRI